MLRDPLAGVRLKEIREKGGGFADFGRNVPILEVARSGGGGGESGDPWVRARVGRRQIDARSVGNRRIGTPKLEVLQNFSSAKYCPLLSLERFRSIQQ